MKNDTLNKKYHEYKKRFNDISDFELVNTFNRETTSKGWTGARGAYLKALKDTFKDREINIDKIGSANSLSLKNAVYLKVDGSEKVIEPIIK